MYTIKTINIVILFLGVSVFLAGCNTAKKNLIQDTILAPSVVVTKNKSRNKSRSFSTLNSEKIDTNFLRGEDSEWSFKSFVAGAFVGTDFLVGKLLADRPKHQSYYATYMSNGLKISATWHVPKADGPHPVVILNHGYFPPATYTNGYGFGREQKYLADRGYAVLHIDYRGYGFSDKDLAAHHGQRFGYMGYATDAVNAVNAVRAADLATINTTRIAMLGHSMGGGVTLSVITAQPDLLDAAVIWGATSGNYQKNFEQWSRERLTDGAKKIFETDFGSINDPDSFKALSSNNYFDRIKTPLSIHHGVLDEDVPVEWSRETVSILVSLDKDFEYIEHDDYGHVFWGDDWINVMEQSEKFLRKYLFD